MSTPTRTTGTAAIVGPGNIGTDLMFKLTRRSDVLDPALDDRRGPGIRRLALGRSRSGPDASPRGRRLAAPPRTSCPTSSSSATSAKGRMRRYAPRYAEAGILAVDLTPARGRAVPLPAGQPRLQPRRRSPSSRAGSRRTAASFCPRRTTRSPTTGSRSSPRRAPSSRMPGRTRSRGGSPAPTRHRSPPGPRSGASCGTRAPTRTT